MAHRKTSRRVRRRRTLLGLAIIVVIALGLGVVAYVHLDSNLRTLRLTGGGSEHANSAGATPINVLVIGSDTRASSADCKLGGDCSAQASTSTDATSVGANADVEMLVHISADRSNATVMSIPRDTVVDLPACTNPTTGATVPAHRDRINSTFANGPSCTVSAIHRLTGVPIDHFMVIDFAGVVRMSDAVGGVKVCVNQNVYDPYSHLKLAKGSHTLTGLAALEFLRTRHGFGDGSDLGREAAQHLFLAAMLRQMEQASTLANPVKVYELADAATKAITVDPGLGSVKDLASLAYQVNKVPGSHTTFITMPTIPNPQNSATVIPGPTAAALFRELAADISLTQKKKARSSTAARTSAATHPSATPSASSNSDRTTVTAATGCAQVSTQGTVTVNGQVMTPTQAYAASPRVPVSAP
ncbi:LCP family protein [Leekyejoonella antrihumi]|uniref:LCP family protein n=1 Tax=Leekyejoonella antrihumi TaxID=1660198 RepID=UPI001C95CF35|nr:LCP family protein [Leekyejoonella antrihumi]